MGRPRRYETDAERQAAYRARKRGVNEIRDDLALQEKPAIAPATEKMIRLATSHSTPAEKIVDWWKEYEEEPPAPVINGCVDHLNDPKYWCRNCELEEMKALGEIDG